MNPRRLAALGSEPCALALVALLVLLALVAQLQPQALSAEGLPLLLGLSLPLVLATLAQAMVLVVGDLDFSIGAFVSLVACVAVTVLPASAALALLLLVALVLAYMGIAALISWRRLPALVVTLGLSFVWLGLALLVRPGPGGQAPDWLVAALAWPAPGLPLQAWLAVLAGAGAYLLLWHSRVGLLLRAAGGSPAAVRRAGASLLRIRVIAYGLAGTLGVLAGLVLAGLATSADAGMAGRYTLLSIAAVLLGGGSLAGGRVSVLGAAAGAWVMVLADAVLAFIAVSATWQVAAQGLILLAVLALRAALQGGGDS